MKRVFIYTAPYAGHCNPVFGICKRLLEKNVHTQISVYGDASFRSLFEKCGCEFREYKHSTVVKAWTNQITGFQVASQGLKIAQKLMVDACADVIRDNPDLIMYDKGK